MLFYFLVIGSLLQVMSVQCINGDEVIDGAEKEDIDDVVDWSNNELENVPQKDSDFSERTWFEKERAKLELIISKYQEESSIPKKFPDLQNFFLEVKTNTNIPVENGAIDVLNFLNEIKSNEVAPANTLTIDIQKLLNEIESNADIPEEMGTFNIQDLLNEMESNTDIPKEMGIFNIQDLLNEIKSNTDIPEEIGTFNIQDILNEIEANTDIPKETETYDIHNLQYEIDYNTNIPKETETIDIQYIQYEIESDLNGHHSSIYTIRKTAGFIGIIITVMLAPFIIYNKFKARKDLKLRLFVISRKSEDKKPLSSV
ncbi:uncharacterized protein [Parasteatoda tepidariorum]|uniref:uncharacterized protein n=1 Tax=Parasteatoda tepidariorum TaxID=114398 RepID=UPI00077F81EF|nr:uncharacterized protein LOC107452912 [Parasteatoda tepidariorum]XP_015925037.1 uncharacterized protein LOC107452912 [Parasteatoda tepidariorum]